MGNRFAESIEGTEINNIRKPARPVKREPSNLLYEKRFLKNRINRVEIPKKPKKKIGAPILTIISVSEASISSEIETHTFGKIPPSAFAVWKKVVTPTILFKGPKPCNG